MTAAPTATDFAREAWALLARADDPMPPMAALDWLRERLETDDVAAVKAALYGAAADSIPHGHLTMWQGTPSDVRNYMREGKFVQSWIAINYMREEERSLPDGDTPIVLAWCDRADAALALCRQIEAL